METPIYNPSVPYIGHVSGGFRSGRMVRIQGRISPNSHGFTINLLCGSNANQDDIALHFNPRFGEQAVVRNSKNYSSWGQEERYGHFPFASGNHFEVMILCEAQQYKVAVNGQHFIEFMHRVPVDRITCIGIEGDVTVSLIQFEGTATAPPPSAPMMNASASYPTSGANIGFVPPPYPTSGSGIPPYPPSNVASYPPPPAYGSPSYGPPGGSYPPAQPQYGQPAQPQYGQPAGGYPPPPQYGYPSSPGHQKSGGLLDNAGKLLAGGLAGVGLASVANKIPGMGGHGHGGHHGGHMGGGHMGHGGGGSGLPGAVGGGLLGSAAALGVGGLLAGKAMKKGKKKNKLLSYGLPAAGILGTGYVAHKGMKGMKKGFGGRSSSSSSSSSSEEE